MDLRGRAGSGLDFCKHEFPGLVSVFCHHFRFPVLATFAFEKKLFLSFPRHSLQVLYNQVIER